MHARLNKACKKGFPGRLGSQANLTRNKLTQILRVGVTHIKYVSLPNSRAWVIHNFKDTRGRGQPNKVVADTNEDKLIVSNETPGITKSQGEETQETATKDTTHVQQVLADSTGSVSNDAPVSPQNQTEASDSAPAEKSVSETDDVGSTNRVSSVTTQTDLTESSEQHAGEEAGDDEGDLRGGDGGAGSSWRLEKNKELLNTRLGPYTRSMSPRKKSRAEKMTDSTGPKPTSTYERIRLQILPWKKPEGYLNKPVFSFMLHSLLLYVISNPGITFGNLSGRFQPYLLPFHLLELLLILEEIGCVNKLILTPEAPLSVFSPRQLPHPVSAEDQEENDVVHYEATSNALSFLGMFLEQVQGTDSVQLHRGRKTSQTDGKKLSTETKTGASNQNRGNPVQELEMTSQADRTNVSTETETDASHQDRGNPEMESEMTSQTDGINVSTGNESESASTHDRGNPGQVSEVSIISENTHVHQILKVGQTSDSAQNLPEVGQTFNSAQNLPEVGQTFNSARNLPEVGQTFNSAQNLLEVGQTSDSAQNLPEVGQTFDDKQELAKAAHTSDSSLEVPEVDHTSAGAQELSKMEISGVNCEVNLTDQSRDDSGISQEAMEVDN